MTTRELVDDFLAQKRLALVGASSSGRKFGNMAWKELAARGYEVFAVHPRAESIGGTRCWRSLAELPAGIGGVLISVPPGETEKVVREAAAAGIPRVWMQQGSQSADAIRFCRENGIAVVHDQCILLYAEPVRSFHAFHRWLWRLLGKLPASVPAH